MLAFALLFSLVSCSTYSEKDLDHFDNQITKHIDSLGLDMKKMENGLYYKILDEGDGERTIQYADQVTFYYKGSFLDGHVFQLIGKDEPLTYQVKELIVGWQDALMLLKEHGSIQIIIPPQLGYGDENTPMIPPNSVLKYELHVTEVK